MQSTKFYFFYDCKILLTEAFSLSKYYILFFWQVDPLGAQEKVIEISSSLGLSVSVAVAHEITVANTGNR